MDDQVGDNFDTASNGEDAELYLLKWNSHQHHFANKFSELLDEDDISFADVTLACEGNFLQAHRLVLSVCSPYFKNLFKVNCAEKGPATIIMANVRYTDLENILHFMYRGQVNVRKEDLNKFLETGEQLQIDGLMGQHAAQNSNKQNNPAKRRFSEGGQGMSNAGGGLRSGAQQIMANRNGGTGRSSLPPQQQTQYKIVTSAAASGNATVTSRTSGTNSQTLNVDSNPAKKSRISPTTGLNNNNSTNSATSRRASTSSHVSNATTSSSPSHFQKVEEVDTELIEANNGIKILAVASMNSSTASASYDSQGNEIYEILDYEGDDGGDMEMDDSDLVNYGDDGGDDGMYYYHQSSTSPYVRSSLNSSQQSRLGPQVTARYPSIIDGVHFELISADEKRVAAQCKLCPGEKVIRGSGLTSSNFISHLRAFHKRELEEWREKRKTESRRRMD